MLTDPLLNTPTSLWIESDDSISPLLLSQPQAWRAQDVLLELEVADSRVRIFLQAPRTPLQRVFLYWQFTINPGWRFLGDAWERGYGDLEWRGIVAERIMPWYVAATRGPVSEGFGVETGGAALAYWQVNASGVKLVLDVRCGGKGVCLGERRLPAATLIVHRAPEGRSPFAAVQELCQKLCPAPRLPAHPVYGSNDWYYAYGNNSQDSILRGGQITSDLSPNLRNRPYVVIDAGWQTGESAAACDRCDRRQGNARFPDMPALADALKQMGTRPGIWVRPLLAPAGIPPSRCLQAPEKAVYAHLSMLDPSLPENLALIAEDIGRLKQWGYQLIKHDFSTVDILGRWGFEMGSEITPGNWAFQDRGRTTAEIVGALYRTIRTAASDEVLLIGCNTIGHLAAGQFELQRTGDDTSGQEWERTRKMGVNTLAFRMPQHRTFFLADGDCVGLTAKIPWSLNARWLDLLAHSGTPLFVSAEPEALGAAQRHALKASYALAASQVPSAVPLDWLDNTCPAHWAFLGKTSAYDWHTP